MRVRGKVRGMNEGWEEGMRSKKTRGVGYADKASVDGKCQLAAYERLGGRLVSRHTKYSKLK